MTLNESDRTILNLPFFHENGPFLPLNALPKWRTFLFAFLNINVMFVVYWTGSALQKAVNIY